MYCKTERLRLQILSVFKTTVIKGESLLPSGEQKNAFNDRKTLCTFYLRTS